MVIKGRKIVALAAMISVLGLGLMTSTTPVVAGTYSSAHAQTMRLHPRPNDLLANLAGAAIGGALGNSAAIAGAIGGSAVAGAVGAVAGVLVAVACPSVAGFLVNASNLDAQMRLDAGVPYLNDMAAVPPTALDI